MNEQLNAILMALGLLVGMLACLEIGRRVGLRSAADDPEGSRQGVGAVDGAIFALFGLLVAFTFSGAAERFSARQHLITKEANDIGTAWLRLDLLPSESQPALRQLFRQYLDARLASYAKAPDMAAVQVENERWAKLQQEIWAQSVAASSTKREAATLLLPALNEMFDITTTRKMATLMHPPKIIFGLLFILALGCAFLAGHGMALSKKRCWTHIFGFAFVMALSVYVILDLEYPRVGFIRVDHFDKVLIELRESMK